MKQWKNPKLLIETHGITCEGPIWDNLTNKLYYIDVSGKLLHIFEWAANIDVAITLPQKVGFVALTVKNDILLGLEDGIYRYTKDGNLQRAHDSFVFAGDRLNDGKVGPDGGLYTGTIQRTGGAMFYRFGGNSFTTLLESVKLSNGLDWSMDGQILYYCDTLTHRIDAFDFDSENGTISNRRPVIEIPEERGSPDGLTIDVDDNLWIALWGGGRVIKVNPNNGEIIGEIILPVSRVSCCSFAGGDLDQLIITTASGGGTTETEPLGGCVFVAQVDTRGRAPFRF